MAPFQNSLLEPKFHNRRAPLSIRENFLILRGHPYFWRKFSDTKGPPFQDFSFLYSLASLNHSGGPPPHGFGNLDPPWADRPWSTLIGYGIENEETLCCNK